MNDVPVMHTEGLCSRTLTHGDLDIRSDGRTVYGRAVPFDTPAEVNDGFGRYTELFRPGAFARTINNNTARVKLLINHDRQRLPIGRAVNLSERSDGLYGEFHVSNTPAGDQALELIRDGVLDAFSIGFAPVKEREQRGVVERLEVKLREVSVVAFPAYEDALIGGVRTNTSDEVLRQFYELGRALGINSHTPTIEPDPDQGTSTGGPVEDNDNPAPATCRIPRHLREHHAREIARKLHDYQ